MTPRDRHGKHDPRPRAGEDTRDAKGGRAGTKPGHKGAGTSPPVGKPNTSGRGGGNPDPPETGGRGGGNSN